MYFGDSKRDGEGGSYGGGYGQPPAGGYPDSNYGHTFSEVDEDDGELPF